MKILIDISFVGTGFCGYQVQPGKRTVQGELNAACKQLFGYDCDVVGCSRTDSGVHANQFFATVTKKGSDSIDTVIETEKIPSALSFYLPNDISVKSAVAVEEGFHSRYSVKYKEYVYRIWNSRERNPFVVDRSWHYPRALDDDAVARMAEAAKSFVGTHDFSSFMASNSGVKSTVRTVFEADVQKNGNEIVFRVCGDGFLYNMVRIMMGTLIAVGENKISVDSIETIINEHNRSAAGVTAPPQGLYLNRVVY